MPLTEMIVGISAGLFFLLAFIFFLRLVQAWLLHRTLRDAIAKNSEQAGLLVDSIARGELGGGRNDGGTDDRTGLVLVALGIALAGFSIIVGDPQWLRYGIGGALFPVLTGAALLIRHRLLGRRGEPDSVGA
jgi:hypothetical protein